MTLNREQRRMLQRQGEIDETGEPVRTRRAAPAAQAKEERTGATDFVKEVRGELKKVAWPTREETIRYTVIVFITLVLYPAAAWLGGMSIRAFARAALPSQAVAFSSRSSLAALPALIETSRDTLRLPEEISSFFIPLSAVTFRSGAALGLTIGTLFIARIYGADVSTTQVATIVATSTGRAQIQVESRTSMSGTSPTIPEDACAVAPGWARSYGGGRMPLGNGAGGVGRGIARSGTPGKDDDACASSMSPAPSPR